MFDHWKDFFHPHEGNDHHPHAYRRVSAIALACVVGLVLVITAAQTGYIRNSDTFLSSVLPSVLVDLTNENRQSEGLAGLKVNDTLTQAAQLKANHMAENGYFAHDSPSGVTPWHWFEEVGYTYETAGENLAIDFTDSDAVVQAWMESRLHRENILEEDFTEIGIATAEGEYQGRDTVFVVQMFGRPDQRELAERSRGNAESDVAVQTEATTQQSADYTATTSQATTTEELLAQLQNEVNEVQQEVAQQQAVEGTQQEEQKDDSTPDEKNRPVSSGDEDKDVLAQASSDPPVSESNQEGSHQATTTAEPATTTDTATTTNTAEPGTITTTNESDPQTDTFATPTAVGQVQGSSGTGLFSSGEAGMLSHILSQPQTIYQLAFAVIAGLIVLALLISIIVEAKRHHWKLAGYSLLALVILTVVFYFGSQLLFTEPVVASAQRTVMGSYFLSL